MQDSASDPKDSYLKRDKNWHETQFSFKIHKLIDFVTNLRKLIKQYFKTDAYISCSMYQDYPLEIFENIEQKLKPFNFLNIYRQQKICFE